MSSNARSRQRAAPRGPPGRRPPAHAGRPPSPPRGDTGPRRSRYHDSQGSGSRLLGARDLLVSGQPGKDRVDSKARPGSHVRIAVSIPCKIAPGRRANSSHYSDLSGLTVMAAAAMRGSCLRRGVPVRRLLPGSPRSPAEDPPVTTAAGTATALPGGDVLQRTTTRSTRKAGTGHHGHHDGGGVPGRTWMTSYGLGATQPAGDMPAGGGGGLGMSREQDGAGLPGVAGTRAGHADQGQVLRGRVDIRAQARRRALPGVRRRRTGTTADPQQEVGERGLPRAGRGAGGQRPTASWWTARW